MREIRIEIYSIMLVNMEAVPSHELKAYLQHAYQ